MSVEAQSEISIEGAQALLAHLRENRQDANMPARELAERFGLNASFVQNLLAQTERPEDLDGHHRVHIPTGSIKAGFRTLIRVIDICAARSSLFVGVTSGVCIALIWLSGVVIDLLWPKSADSLKPLAFFGLVIVGVGLHYIVYYRRAMIRYVLFGALVVWVMSSVASMISCWVGTAGQENSARTLVVWLMAVATFVVSGLYAMLGCFFSVVGGYVRLLRTERREEKMTRQQMLERYFELQEGLSAPAATVHLTWEDWPSIRFVRKHLLWSGVVIGFATNLPLTLWSELQNSPIANSAPVVTIIIVTLLMVVRLLFFVAITFLGGGIGPAVAIALLFAVGSIGAEVVNVGHPLPASLMHMKVVQYLIGCLADLAMGAVLGIGATIQRRAVREVNLQKNDHATVLAEMLRIQWRLSEETTSTCVMVVDVVRSSAMKSGADSLNVEYSFREYQAWIERTCRPYRGRVHSTAGDGAVVAFPTCADALVAAKKLQGGIEAFNKSFNRLSTAFRVRIGLHVDQVQGDLQQVQFSEVIDIAAHVEKISPASGIAATQEVVAQLDEADFVPLARSVDGHAVFLALDPVEL